MGVCQQQTSWKRDRKSPFSGLYTHPRRLQRAVFYLIPTQRKQRTLPPIVSNPLTCPSAAAMDSSPAVGVEAAAIASLLIWGHKVSVRHFHGACTQVLDWFTALFATRLGLSQNRYTIKQDRRIIIKAFPRAGRVGQRHFYMLEGTKISSQYPMLGTDHFYNSAVTGPKVR